MDERALYRTIQNLTRRIEKLEQQNKFTTATDWMPGNWWGRVTPTQPASRIVNVHGGFLWVWDGTGTFRRLSDSIYDLSSVTAFAGSQSYRWAVLQADLSTNPPTLTLYEGEEFTTAEACENDFFSDGTTDDLYGTYFPLCAFVLRNNGTLGGVVGAIENVTLGDTSQSYILVKDFRPWLHLHS